MWVSLARVRWQEAQERGAPRPPEWGWVPAVLRKPSPTLVRKSSSQLDSGNVRSSDYDKEKVFIDSVLSVGKYAISHSSDYREAYNPHYRIVERKIFEREIKPAIELNTKK